MRLHPRSVIVLGMLWTGLAASSRADEPALGPGLVLQGRSVIPGGLAPAASRRNPIVVAVDRVRGSVVNIHSERTVHSAPAESFTITQSQGRVNGMGTGIIIDPRGYIVTCHHVVEEVSVIRVRLGDGTQYVASIVARSPEMDLAL